MFPFLFTCFFLLQNRPYSPASLPLCRRPRRYQIENYLSSPPPSYLFCRKKVLSTLTSLSQSPHPRGLASCRSPTLPLQWWFFTTVFFSGAPTLLSRQLCCCPQRFFSLFLFFFGPVSYSFPRFFGSWHPLRPPQHGLIRSQRFLFVLYVKVNPK